MSDDYFEYADEPDANPRLPDLAEGQAVDALRELFDAHVDRVYSSRQLEVLFEDRYFHWITHRAIRLLADEGSLQMEQRTLSYGAPINLVWHRRNRYVRRQVKEVLRLVEAYSHPDFTAALGNTGELLVSDGFGRFGFRQRGRNAQAFGGRRWTRSDHNLDFIFERDGRCYGVEVKNTLPYINDRELGIKLEMCEELALIPLFVVRAMPAIWILEVSRKGGFTLVLRHQLYPLSHKSFAAEVREKLGLPVDAPKALFDGTMKRFENWHVARLST